MNTTCLLPLVIAEYFSPDWELAVCQGISIYLGIQSVVLNFTIFCYYSRDSAYSKIIPFLYKITASFDILTGLTGFLNGGYFAILRSESLHPTLCLPLTDTSSSHVTMQRVILILSSNLSSFTTSSTAFLHTLLTVVRCINIASPFYEVRVGCVKRVYWTYLVIIGLVIGTDFSYMFINLIRSGKSAESYFYYVIFVRVISLVKNDMLQRGSSNLTFWLHLILDLCVPFALPCLVCVVCLVALIWALNFDNKSPSITQTREHIATQRRITKTIAMLAALFVTCNSFYIAVIAMQRYFNSQSATQKWHGKAATLGFCLVPLINSALNPLIFICRSKTLKKFTSARLSVDYLDQFMSPKARKAMRFVLDKLSRDSKGSVVVKETGYTPLETASTIVKTQTIEEEGEIVIAEAEC